MPPKFAIPGHAELAAEQAQVQAEKFQARLLGHYGQYLERGQTHSDRYSPRVTDYIADFTGGEVSVPAILDTFHQAEGKPAHWVDMGGGRGLAMRQLATTPDAASKYNLTLVDLFDVGLDGLQPAEIALVESLNPNATADQAKPRFIAANAETVRLPEPAQLITAVESSQYLNNPLGAICNWYNQLSDNGLVVISNEHEWTVRVRYEKFKGVPRDETPVKHLLTELSNKDVKFATAGWQSWIGIEPDAISGDLDTIVIQKKPGTQLELRSDLADVWVNPDNYKYPYYEPTAAPYQIMEVTAVQPLSAVV